MVIIIIIIIIIIILFYFIDVIYCTAVTNTWSFLFPSTVPLLLPN